MAVEQAGTAPVADATEQAAHDELAAASEKATADAAEAQAAADQAAADAEAASAPEFEDKSDSLGQVFRHHADGRVELMPVDSKLRA